MSRTITLAMGLVLMSGCATASQPQLNWRTAPTYGTVQLSAGFTPDPWTQSLQAGGQVNAASVIGGGACTGFIHGGAPDVTLNYRAASLPLHFHAESNEDTTLVVLDPNGRWYCNDDAIGLNPVVDIENPRSGTYHIWVGTYSQGALPPAQLHITELNPRWSAQAPANTGAEGAAPNWAAEPTYATVELSAGFAPDPWTHELHAGGSHDISSSVRGCTGFIHAAAPDVDLNYTATSTLPLHIRVESGSDTTLAVLDPEGNWHCNDDSVGLDPLVSFDRPQSGNYNIWVGTYSQDLAPATLLITELDMVATRRDGSTGFGGGTQPSGQDWPNPDAAPSYGAVQLSAGFTPDPWTQALQAGGNDDARASIGGECVGYIHNAAPDVTLTYRRGMMRLPLFIYALSSADTTLVVLDPQGNWHCNDDAIGLNPMLVFRQAAAGEYRIWVGTYSQGLVPAELRISEIDPS